MASIIKSSKVVVANSSIAFPIAEGLNKPRLLEACPYFPAAQPHDKCLWFLFSTSILKACSIN